MGTAERHEPKRAGKGGQAAQPNAPSSIGNLQRRIERYRSLPPIYVGLGAIGSAVGALFTLRTAAFLLEVVRRLPAFAQRAGVVGLGWGVLVVGLAGFVALLLYRSSCHRRELQAIQTFKREETRALEVLSTTLRRLMQTTDPLQLHQDPTQLVQLLSTVLQARHGVELQSSVLNVVLSPKEGNAMRNALDSSINPGTPRADGGGYESSSDGR